MQTKFPGIFDFIYLEAKAQKARDGLTRRSTWAAVEKPAVP
jgi:hypothetical protein